MGKYFLGIMEGKKKKQNRNNFFLHYYMVSEESRTKEVNITFLKK